VWLVRRLEAGASPGKGEGCKGGGQAANPPGRAWRASDDDDGGILSIAVCAARGASFVMSAGSVNNARDE
jgi:hypothetical protein